MPRILVLAAHPDLRLSRVNRRLLKAARVLSGSSSAPAAGPGNSLVVRDLYALYPDYLIDVPAEQAELATADLVVWLHPIHWYAMPPLMKLWLDEVLTLGWAYGPGGHALRGKDLWLVLSTGGSEQAYAPTGYNRYFFDAFLPPYDQTAALCGMRLVPPLVLHGAHAVSDVELDAHVEQVVAQLRSYPDWPELDDLDTCPACELPAQARPQDERAGLGPGAPISLNQTPS